MNSLRLRLFVMVAGITILVWAGAAIWTAISTRAEVEQVLDRRLVEAARMVAALDVPVNGETRRLEAAPYSRQLSCQIWSLDGTLLGQSAGAPEAPLASGAPGFSEQPIGEEAWRVYTHVDPARGVRVMVGDNLEVRSHLVRDLMLGLLLPAAAGLVALGLLLWLGVGGGLAPLGRITRALDARPSGSLEPFAVRPVPEELQPLVRAMDALLARMEAARSAERDFVANAAHELQTPLAGLKTQAEVARRATDPAIRDHALERIEASVDRTSRLVRQLLELARQEGREADPADQGYAPLGDVIGELEREFTPLAKASGRSIEVSCALGDVAIAMSREALVLALGNLVENAIQHGRGAVRITCTLEEDFTLRVVDSGEGITDGEISRIRRRFERGRGVNSSGTGLGLSIVEAAIAPSGGVLELAREPSGFASVLRFPASRVCRDLACHTDKQIHR